MGDVVETTKRDSAHLVSEALAKELKREVRGAGIVVWADVDAQYKELASSLANGDYGFEYPVVAYGGSWLELMLALEPFGSGLRPDHLLVHLPHVNKDTIKDTPLLELAKAGKIHERNLGTAVREASVGYARPEDVEAFLAQKDLDVTKADAWLAGHAAGAPAGVGVVLDTFGVEGVVLGLLARDPRITPHLPAASAEVLAFVEKGIGLDAAWRQFRIGEAALGPDVMASLIASWLMAVEFAFDLKTSPVTPALRALRDLSEPHAAASRKLVAAFRTRLPELYEELEAEMHPLLAEERASHHADALGNIDTFRFEESAIRAAALDALRAGEWERAYGFAKDRTPEASFWVRRAPSLERTWELVRLAATAGRAIANDGALGKAASIDAALETYASALAPIDYAHRAFEQRAHAALTPDLDDHAALLEARAALRRAYRTWTDGVNRSFAALCEAHGPLASRNLQQRTLYADVVQRALDQGARTAFFMVDALRFEMAQGFAAELAKDRWRVTVGARLSELPSDTSVGMNALAPIDDGGPLRPIVKDGKIDGFRSQEFAVRQPKDRIRAIGARSLGQDPPDIELEKFADLDTDSLKKRIGKSRLVVVRSRELDDAGENNLHLAAFEQILVQVKSAIALLAQAGIEHFVITSDHGFLLQDGTVEAVQLGPTMRVADRRYAILDAPSGKPDVLEVRLSSLGYEVEKDLYLVFARDTRVWKTQSTVAAFVRGGNSLQERVIPVLEIERSTPRGRTLTKYEVVATAKPAELGRQRLEIAVRLQDHAVGSLAFEGPRAISLALRVPGRADITVTLVGITPPGELGTGRVLLPPNRDAAVLEFEIQGPIDERVRVEVYHPDGSAEVTPKTVEGFFDVAGPRTSKKGASIPPPKPGADTEWESLVEDEGYRKVVRMLAQGRSLDESELSEVLGSSRRVRSFARYYDDLVKLLPFTLEVQTVNGMKVYSKKG